MGKEGWLHDLVRKNYSSELFTNFLDSLKGIDVTEDHIKGKVLVIGQSMFFPERALVCTPESDFRELRVEVENVYCCDSEPYTSPELNLDIACINLGLLDDFPQPAPKTAYWQASSCDNFLPDTPLDYFDTVMMMRVVNMGEQIAEYGLIQSIAPHLKPGGFFICSGGRFPLNLSENFFSPLELIDYKRLYDFNRDGYPFSNNHGIVMKRI